MKKKIDEILSQSLTKFWEKLREILKKYNKISGKIKLNFMKSSIKFCENFDEIWDKLDEVKIK